MVKKLSLICASYLIIASPVVATEAPPQLPESFFDELFEKDDKKTTTTTSKQDPSNNSNPYLEIDKQFNNNSANSSPAKNESLQDHLPQNYEGNLDKIISRLPAGIKRPVRFGGMPDSWSSNPNMATNNNPIPAKPVEANIPKAATNYPNPAAISQNKTPIRQAAPQSPQNPAAQFRPAISANTKNAPANMTPRPKARASMPPIIAPHMSAPNNFNHAPPRFAPLPPPRKNVNPCEEIPLYVEQILEEIYQKKSDIISKLPQCFTLDRKLILKAVVIDPMQFQYADDILQEDKIFVNRLLKISPEILQFAAPKIRSDKSFMEEATYINRDALQYASWGLIDNLLFMRKMIDIDSRNYKFASIRIKNMPKLAQIAFEDNGLLLEFAPDKIKNNKKLVKMAILSHQLAINFASKKLQKDPELKKLSKKKSSIYSDKSLEKFLRKNYITKGGKKNLSNIIENQAKFYKNKRLINRHYVTKWQDYIDYSFRKGKYLARNTKLIAADSRNYHILWRDDLEKYPEIIAKINKFLTNHHLPSNVIENLSTTYLWKIKDDPKTLALNLYLLRDSTDEDLGPSFADITSITAILQKRGKKWQMTIVEVILDKETKVDITYPGGHKKHILWDLYTVDEEDDNPKIIFKVEDGLNEYFEVFEEQAGGKYQMIYRSKNL